MKKEMETNILQKKPYRRRYIIAAVFLALLIGTTLGFIYFTQENKSNPASEKIIREAAAIILNKDPNELTDEDFAKITEFSSEDIIRSQKSGASQEVLRFLLLMERTELSDIRPLEKFINLKKLQLRNVDPPEKNIPKWMKILAKLGIYDLDERFALDLSPLKKLKNLQSLSIGMMTIKNFESISSLKNLQTLSISETPISSIEPIKGLTKLKELYINSTNISDLKPLAGLKNLQMLIILGPEISDIEPLRNLTNLEELHIHSTSVSNLEPIRNLKKLKRLNLVDIPAKNIKPLESLTGLQELLLIDLEIADLELIKALTNLRTLRIAECNYITDEQMEDLQKVLPNLKIAKGFADSEY